MAIIAADKIKIYKIKYGIEKWARKSFSPEYPKNTIGRRFKGDKRKYLFTYEINYHEGH